MNSLRSFSPRVLDALWPALAYFALSLLPSGSATAQTSSAKSKSATSAKSTQPPKSQRSAVDSRVEVRSKASQMAAGIMAAEAALTPEELAIAERVHTGVLPCELGSQITLQSDPLMPGYFNMSGKNFRFRMMPVPSSTGAVRLEDRQAGAVWLQLSNKSMLMDQKAGRRMADDCMSPAQYSVAQQMKTNPGPDLLGLGSAPVPALAAPAASPFTSKPGL